MYYNNIDDDEYDEHDNVCISTVLTILIITKQTTPRPRGVLLDPPRLVLDDLSFHLSNVQGQPKSCLLPSIFLAFVWVLHTPPRHFLWGMHV